MSALVTDERAFFHRELVEREIVTVDNKGIASIADSDQRTSRLIAGAIAQAIGAHTRQPKRPGQQAGAMFESAVADFLTATFPELGTLRPGDWEVVNVGSKRAEYYLSRFEPYRHLEYLATAIEATPELQASLGNSYSVSPDVLVTRAPEPDSVINRDTELVDNQSADRTVVREANQSARIVHAVVSCKLTLRSDRAQNARSEALSVIRNRKGRSPHMVVVTLEPTPSRLASLALGTGDIDMVYHAALPELIDGVEKSNNDEAQSMLNSLLEGERLRDIADLPLDLCV